MILILPIIPIVSELFSGEIRRADTPVVFRYKYTTSARRCQANRRKNFGGRLGGLRGLVRDALARCILRAGASGMMPKCAVQSHFVRKIGRTF